MYWESPENYYYEKIRGRSRKAIMTQIRILKRDLHYCKRRLDEGWFDKDINIRREEDGLYYYQKYLGLALREYREAGGVYVPTKNEKKSMDFDTKLSSIMQLVFGVGSLLRGYERRIYTISGDMVQLKIQLPLEKDRRILPEQDICTKEEFIAGLQAIHMWDWKKDYEGPKQKEGMEWELEMYFDPDSHRKTVRKSGVNAYPYNFSELTHLLRVPESLWKIERMPGKRQEPYTEEYLYLEDQLDANPYGFI